MNTNKELASTTSPAVAVPVPASKNNESSSGHQPMPTDNQVPAPPSSDQPIGSTDADKVVSWNWVLRSIENNPDHTVVISRMADGNLSFLHGNPIPELEDEVEALTNALKELVECKDLKDKIDADDGLTPSRLAVLRLEYNDRKPLAWAAARKLVARCANVFVSTTTPGLVHVHEWKPEELKKAWAMFRELLSYWQAKSDYSPNLKHHEVIHNQTERMNHVHTNSKSAA